MRLGTKLAFFLSLIIIVVLLGYGYFHVLSRRDILIRKMKIEVASTGRTLKVSLEKVSIPREMEYVQELIDAVEEYERILGVIVYHQGKNLVFRSRSIKEEVSSWVELIKKSIAKDRAEEEFGVFQGASVYSYSFPLKDQKGKVTGGVSILQHTSFMEEDIRRAKWTIFITLFVLIGGTVTLVLFVTRRWIAQPISQLMGGIERMAKGDLLTRVDLHRGDELSDLAHAFNQMAIDLKAAQDRVIEQAEAKIKLERSLRQSERLATIGQLASELAHEIGTPLNIIYGRAELMQRRLEDHEAARKNLEVILQQTERITKIIQHLLGFVRKKRPERSLLDLRRLLENSLDLLDYQFQKQGVRVETNLAFSLPPVLGDIDLLQQVFLNLILNAVQSMPDGGKLRLWALPKWMSRESLGEERREYVEIGVEDTGTGMEPESLQKIFDPFFTTKEKGTGLGLTVSQGIIQDHEGWIEAESQIGKGSLFKVYLPASREERKPGGERL